VKLSFIVNKNIDLVFEYLTDMEKFALIHPVISRIDKISHQNYKVHETLKFGMVPFSFTYPVTIEKSISEKIVIMRATVFYFTKIEMKFFLRADAGHTIIEEEIYFTSPFPVVGTMKRIFKKQHPKLFETIHSLK